MKRVSQTGNVLLRYGSFENEASSSAMDQRASAVVTNYDNGVDFDDVFGGPPMRTRYSFGGGRIKSSDESTSSTPGLGEKPVFGQSYSSPRRRASDDFYDDIFRRSDESVRSPRWSATTPGSRTLSPAHSEIEPFANSNQAEFSLPAKMSKSVDVPIFGSSSSSPHRYREVASNPHTPTTSLSRFSSPGMQGRDVLRNNAGQSPGHTVLSHESSGVKESPYSTRSTENEVGLNSEPLTAKEGSPSSEFHFSIHKWANIGVPLLISLRGGKHPTLKGSSKVSALSMDNMQDASSQDDDLSLDRGDMEPHFGIGLTEVTEKEVPMVKQEVIEDEVITQRSLLQDKINGEGDEEAGREAEVKENMETMSGVSHSDVDAPRKKKLEAKKTSSSIKAEANKSAVGSPKSSGETFGKSRVKGMVKDFFKMSNPGGPPKTKTNVAARSLSSRWKTTAKNKSDEQVSDSMSNLDSTVPAADVEMMPDASYPTDLDSKLPAENVKMEPDVSSTIPLDGKAPADTVNMMPDASFTVKEHIGRTNKQKFARNRTIKKVEDVYSQVDASATSESVPYGSKATVENIDDPSLDNFQVKELSLDEDKLSKTGEAYEAMRALDSKIHLWSSGRKGNIRSLLSTLQLVLWAESGWKPVALVDIIETNAVKKAYNRAMLCLHPDKLQQKGADSHKKYMAEKIFDILQEAWDHFNSLGTGTLL